MLFTYNELKHTEDIKNRFIINVKIAVGKPRKPSYSQNPRKDYPWGVQFSIGGHSFAAASANYFITPNHSIEFGHCGRGIYYGTKRYFSLKDEGNNQALYLGAMSNISIDSGIKLYFPLGYHVLSGNGMGFGIEIAGAIPLYEDRIFDYPLLNYLGLGINFGFQF